MGKLEELEKRILRLEKKVYESPQKRNRQMLHTQEPTQYIDVAEEVMSHIKKNFPGMISKTVYTKRVNEGATAIRKLVEKHNYPLQSVKNCLIWATTNSFWKTNFQAISPILKISNTTSLTKFESMFGGWLRDGGIEGVLHNAELYLIKLKYDKEEIDRLIDAVHWLYLELQKFVDNLPNNQKGKWHLSSGFIKIMEWFIDVDYDIVENSIVSDGVGVLTHYFNYLNTRIDDGKIKKIYPSVFSDDTTFYRFVHDFNQQHNILLFG